MPSRRQPLRPAVAVLAAFLLTAALGAASCKPKQQAPPQMPPPEVSVIKLAAAPVTVSEDYAAQAEAVDTVEIRARVGGVLVRQAFEDGARVRKGQTMYVIDQEPFKVALAQARAALAQAQANYLNAQQELARVRPLVEAQAASQRDLDAAAAAEKAGKAAVEAAEAAVAQAELNLEYTTVRAPRDGDVSSSLVRPGSLVNANSTLMATLYSEDPIYINTTISEDRLLELARRYGGGLGRELRGGPAVKVVMADGSAYRYPARINFFGPAVDKQTGTLAVRVSVPNPGRLIRPGQFVRLVFPERTIRSAIMVPLQAVQEKQDVKDVLVVGPGGTVEARRITGDRSVGNELVVEGGLHPGETVIVEGTAKVRPGMKVKPVPAGAAPASPGKPGA